MKTCVILYALGFVGPLEVSYRFDSLADKAVVI